MSARDDLADLLEATWWAMPSPADHIWEKLADAVIAAGWRPAARVIENPEELTDLPSGSVLIDRQGLIHHGAAVQRYSRFLIRRFGPLTLVWTPGTDDEVPDSIGKEVHEDV